MCGRCQTKRDCIIVKQLVDTYGSDVIKELKKIGIKARNEGIYQDFLKEECIQICLNVLSLSLGKKSADYWSETLELLLKVNGLDSNARFSDISKLEMELKLLLVKINNLISTVNEEKQLHDVLWHIIEFFKLDSLKSLFVQYKAGDRIKDLVNELSSLM